MISLLQILPRVPPAVCGIGDYAWRLAQAMRDGHGIQSSFLSAGTTWVQPDGETEFPVFRLPELSASSLLASINARRDAYDAVLLHMSPYGYQKRAVPFWMASGWKQLSKLAGHPAMLTMFHELYASGSMRTSAFWLQPLQKWVLRQIATASDGLRTNREPYAAWLDRVPGVKAGKTTVMPVFSNFGEMENPPPLAERPAAMVTFSSGIHGGGDAMQAIGKAAGLCERFELDTLHLIGGPKPEVAKLGSVRLSHRVFLPSNEASSFLAGCRLAYTGYHPLFLGKSTILAGFAAHGIAVITRGEQTELPDGLRENREVLHEQGLENKPVPNLEALQILAGNLHRWYADHSLAKNAASYAADIERVLKP